MGRRPLPAPNNGNFPRATPLNSFNSRRSRGPYTSAGRKMTYGSFRSDPNVRTIRSAATFVRS